MKQTTSPEETNKQIVELTVIARKLTTMSVAILEVVGKAPDVHQLLRIAYERFRTIEVMRSVLRELNPELMRPVPIYAGHPKTTQQIEMEKAQGRILYVSTRPLSNYPPKKYKALIIQNLIVDSDGTVTLK